MTALAAATEAYQAMLEGRARAGKKCVGGAAREVEAGKGHAAFKYADVCPVRLEVQVALL